MYLKSVADRTVHYRTGVIEHLKCKVRSARTPKVQSNIYFHKKTMPAICRHGFQLATITEMLIK